MFAFEERNVGQDQQHHKPEANKQAMNTPDETFVTVPGPEDILLGRGAPFLSYEGNQRFRAIVKTRRAKYKQALKNQMKNIIAREVHNAVTENGGRFLMQVLTGKEAPGVAIDGEAAKTGRLWKVAPKKVSLEKCKQALRDMDPQSRKKMKPADISAPSSKASRANPQESMLFGLANAATMQASFRKSSPGEDSSLTGSSVSSSTSHTPSPIAPVSNNDLLLALSLSNFQQSLASKLQGQQLPLAQPPSLQMQQQCLLSVLQQAQQQQQQIQQANQMQLMGKLLLSYGVGGQANQNQNSPSFLDLLKGVAGKSVPAPSPPPPNNVSNADILNLLASLQPSSASSK